jgi:glycosyltransferase involved in cell wall biosynthesis
VWVPTRFHQGTFAASGVDAHRLVVVPEPVDTDHFHPGRTTPLPLPPPPPAGIATEAGTYPLVPQRHHEEEDGGESHDVGGGRTDGLYRFLSVFKWEERKGWRILLRAYLRIFTSADPVVLYIKTNAYHDRPDYAAAIAAVADEVAPDAATRARVVVLDRPLPAAQMPRLYRAVDAFVLPSRGEGWGRPHVEAMSMALPVIATNWSGPTEYLFASNGYPLPIDGLVTLPSGPFRGHKWAEPSEAALGTLLRHVATHRDEARARGAQARADMVRLYHPDVVARGVLAQLRRIQAHLETVP